MILVDRHAELNFLESQYNSFSSSLVVIYGRRRIGKTALIKEFIKNKRAIYFLASEEPERENIKMFQNICASFLGNEILNRIEISRWDDLFEIVLKNYDSNDKLVIVIDEFQYLAKVNPAFPSIFQRIWDEKLNSSNVMVILCGSLISMMESYVLNYNSPLYGRRTGQIKLKQIPFKHYKEFFDERERNFIEFYAVTGGVPRYIQDFTKYDNVLQGIIENILNPASFLYEEPISLRIPQQKVIKYLSVLMDMDLVKREVPITEENPAKSKKGLYFLNDNYITFWFKFIYPYRSYIEFGNLDYVLKKLKNGFIQNHVSYVFEDICREMVWDLVNNGKFDFSLTKIGRWWNSKNEIDIVGINNETKNILFGECKYSDSPVDVDVFYKLYEKSKSVAWNNDTRKEYFIIFSKSGFTKSLIEIAKKQENLLLFRF